MPLGSNCNHKRSNATGLSYQVCLGLRSDSGFAPNASFTADASAGRNIVFLLETEQSYYAFLVPYSHIKMSASIALTPLDDFQTAIYPLQVGRSSLIDRLSASIPSPLTFHSFCLALALSLGATVSFVFHVWVAIYGVLMLFNRVSSLYLGEVRDSML